MRGQIPWWAGWLPLLLLPACALAFLPADWPRWAWMWTLAFAIFLGCKWLTWSRARTSAPWWRHAGYWFAWPGLDASTFLDQSLVPDKPSLQEWFAGLAKLVIGGLILSAVRLIPADSAYVAGWFGMVGIVLVLHFGLFHLLSCGWRLAGIQVQPLMDRPPLATNLRDFWDRRWNRAFRDFIHRFLFRPAALRFGSRAALLIGFTFSGLVHDVVMSIPSGGGYGGPTLYFVVQALGIMVERSSWGQARGLTRGWRGRVFTATVLLGPVAILFHPPFVIDVVVPFLRMLGAIS